jgi:hypothetical protein
MIVQIKKDDKVKSVGIVKLNLIDYLEGEPMSKMGTRQSLKLEKCPDEHAVVEFTVRTITVSNAATGSETMSMLSEALSVDSGPESEFDFDAFVKPSPEEQKQGPRRRQGSQVRAPRKVVSVANRNPNLDSLE